MAQEKNFHANLGLAHVKNRVIPAWLVGSCWVCLAESTVKIDAILNNILFADSLGCEDKKSSMQITKPKAHLFDESVSEYGLNEHNCLMNWTTHFTCQIGRQLDVTRTNRNSND